MTDNISDYYRKKLFSTKPEKDALSRHQVNQSPGPEVAPFKEKNNR